MRNLHAITAKFMEAAIDPSQWVAAMDAAAAATNSVGAILMPLEGRIPSAPFSESIGALAEDYFFGGWVGRDERNRGLPLLRRYGVFGDLEITSYNNIKSHAYYQEFLARHGLRWFAGVKVAAGEDFWCMAIQRSPAQGPFTASQQAMLAHVSTMLSGAAAVARALGFSRAEAALQAFEVSGSAVAMLDRFGQVIRLNAAAERMLSQDPAVVSRRITSGNHAATRALDSALSALLWRRVDSVVLPPIALPRQTKRPILAYPVRLEGVCFDAFSACDALVVFVDLESRKRLPHDDLRRLFGLTPSEIRLSELICIGVSPREAAEQLGISEETARTTLKRVFAKVGVSRQSELVALMARLILR
jgi:DNA-binding CsgD family transcriptional regulator